MHPRTRTTAQSGPTSATRAEATLQGRSLEHLYRRGVPVVASSKWPVFLNNIKKPKQNQHLRRPGSACPSVHAAVVSLYCNTHDHGVKASREELEHVLAHLISELEGGTYTIIYMGLGSTCSRARPEPAPIARYKEQIERSGNRSLDSGKTNVNY